MITCFFITSMFVLLLLIPGKAQASEPNYADLLNGDWEVTVYGQSGEEHEGIWKVRFEYRFMFGVCTFKDTDYADRLNGHVLEENGIIKVTVQRAIVDQEWNFRLQYYEGTYDAGQRLIEGTFYGVGGPGTWVAKIEGTE